MGQITQKINPIMPKVLQLLPGLLILLVALLFFHLKGVRTSPDSAWYIARGLSLYQGQGYVGPEWIPVTYRGPVFPGLIAVFFWLFGTTVKSAMWVVRTFFVLNVMVVYLLGARLFNRTTGFTAALLVLTSLEIHINASRLLVDTVTPFFILMSLLLLYVAFEEERLIYFSLAGITLGIGFLTKQVAGLFLPLPVILWLVVPRYRKRPRGAWQSLSIFYAGALIPLIPWFIYLDSVDAEVFREIRAGLRAVLSPLASVPAAGVVSPQQTAPTSDFGQQLKQVWFWMAQYYQKDVAEHFILAPLFLLAWGYALLKALVNRSKVELWLVVGLLLSLALVPTYVRLNYGPRQSIHIYLLSYLALAHLLWSVSSYLRSPKIFGSIGVTIIIAIQIFVGNNALLHLFQDTTPSGYLSKEKIYKPSLGLAGWEV